MSYAEDVTNCIGRFVLALLTIEIDRCDVPNRVLLLDESFLDLCA